jgi:hypothetical protein
MGRVFVDISMSLDGYVTAPNDDVGRGLGDGGECLHYWIFGGPWTYAATPARGQDGQPVPARASAPSACAARAPTRSDADGRSLMRSMASLAHTGSGGRSPRSTPS